MHDRKEMLQGFWVRLQPAQEIVSRKQKWMRFMEGAIKVSVAMIEEEMGILTNNTAR